ncbi:Protoporphyrinogen oxidase [Fomitiporia mediterranea MF3/22]|uniref:Protoporphyrinogen oxidase n=1 Tax=Fomitiporia mediterranea (strain MF3/22) TaxID=694068 RepID=UPI0004408127|nr:Protoporphyrinogen oxidase [Fomitiporia mediterranea MF3/22]EJD01326.1 Protoporphyrinogen oxidase [Fomitiporia mediterranea MF3/22]
MPKVPPSTIAVLGGGITGLSAAFHLTRRFPQARIIIFEKSSRLGGWIRSRRVEVKDSVGSTAQMLLEAGPRTLKPNSPALLELTNLLGLNSSLLTVPKSSPAAKDRYLHRPGTRGLLSLPSSPFSVFTSPGATAHLLQGILIDLIRIKNRNKDVIDETVGRFLQRRFGPNFERMFGSALVHGIYAADDRRLSVNAAFPSLYEAEERGNGIVTMGLFSKMMDRFRFNEASQEVSQDDYDVGELRDLMKDTSVFSYVDGIETLPRALSTYLRNSGKVTIRTNAPMKEYYLKADLAGIRVIIVLENGEVVDVSHVVAAMPPPLYSRRGETTPPFARSVQVEVPTSSVTVINIVFPPSKHPIIPPGFGYLVPRHRDGYEKHNIGFLGTVFDSNMLSDQDQGASGFIKLTVMMGGPYSLTPSHTKIENVLAQLQLHLSPINHRHQGTRLPWPVYYEVVENKKCIPIPEIGHLVRRKHLREALQRSPWFGRMEVIGASYDGVSVADCVEAGRNAGKDW